MFKIFVVSALGFMMATVANAETSAASGNDNPRLTGDVGLALYRTPAITRSTGNANIVLPYAAADFGSFFARVDTFGVKLIPMGTGYVELSGRISFEGYKPLGSPGIQNRSTPVPIGLSTYQATPYGAFLIHGFYDTNSGGTLLDATYAAEFTIADLHIYPQVGVERRSANYVQHLYGVSAQESAASGNSIAAYTPGSSITPNLGFVFDYPLHNDYGLTLQVRKRWLDKQITDSPLVIGKSQLSGFLALVRSFK